ncbi:hypothetical protein F5I97DRAFT_1295634 [Phlebopus sp. FC_14]|nr:hypothetical protein F5I97DRAFT_1295634 [Phlebopus sp. FC_14]
MVWLFATLAPIAAVLAVTYVLMPWLFLKNNAGHYFRTILRTYYQHLNRIHILPSLSPLFIAPAPFSFTQLFDQSLHSRLTVVVSQFGYTSPLTNRGFPLECGYKVALSKAYSRCPGWKTSTLVLSS